LIKSQEQHRLKRLARERAALGTCLVAALLAGCGALRQAQDDTQPPLDARGTIPIASNAKSSPYTVLYSFQGGNDGNVPVAGLIVLGHTLYGTTQFGGNTSCYTTDLGGCGTVFAIEPSGKERVVYRFQSGDDGQYPMADLIAVNGTLYGTTAAGGNQSCGAYSGCGTVFEVTPSGKERVIYRFAGEPDASKPRAALVLEHGKLLGTTSAGGVQNGGAIFAVSLHGKEDVVASFNYAYGGGPQAALLDAGGVFHGTTNDGGASGDGTAFAATNGKVAVLHTFNGAPDGAHPIAPQIKSGSTVYGTTQSGGESCNCGTVFSLTANGKERIVHRFSGLDGRWPYAGLTEVGDAFYGTTKLGGEYDDGSIFKMTPSGTEEVLYSFGAGGRNDGWFPESDLLYWKGSLYGTTSFGGAGNYGTVFRLQLSRRRESTK
jgi:uncharacterized repeat protein (TIGR03803 family)